MKAALRTRLLADATISGMVGQRIDWGLRPQGKALPAIRLTKIATPRDYTMEGAQATQFHIVQADCYAATFKAVQDLGDAVIACLEPASGSFLASFIDRDRDASERTETSEIHNRSLDIKITYVSA